MTDEEKIIVVFKYLYIGNARDLLTLDKILAVNYRTIAIIMKVTENVNIFRRGKSLLISIDLME